MEIHTQTRCLPCYHGDHHRCMDGKEVAVTLTVSYVIECKCPECRPGGLRAPMAEATTA